MRLLYKIILTSFLLSSALFATPNPDIKVPYISFPMKEGKGMYSTKGKCNMCHSWGYTLNQGLQSKKFWKEKVIKMIKVFNAPINNAKDIETVTNYLFENYGNGKLE